VVCVLAFTEDVASHYFAELRQWKAEKDSETNPERSYQGDRILSLFHGAQFALHQCTQKPLRESAEGFVRVFNSLAAPVAATII